MKICDRCMAPAVDEITFEHDDQKFDLCASCRQVILEKLTSKKIDLPQDDKETPSSAKRKKNG